MSAFHFIPPSVVAVLILILLRGAHKSWHFWVLSNEAASYSHCPCFSRKADVLSTEVTTGVVLVCIKLGGAVICAVVDMIKFPKLGGCLVATRLLFHKLKLCCFFLK
jgi:hypothetical protein